MRRLPTDGAVLRAARHALCQFLSVDTCRTLDCFTDLQRAWLARGFCAAAEELGLVARLHYLGAPDDPRREIDRIVRFIRALGEDSLVLSILGPDVGGRSPYREIFPNFRRPAAFTGISGTIRRRCDERGLLRQLCTERRSAEEVVRRYRGLMATPRVWVTAPGGTDLRCRLHGVRVLPFAVGGRERHAYLPPAEIAFSIAPDSAEGHIVTDVTVGEFAARGVGIIDPMGRVDEPVHLRVSRGRVREVRGGPMARRLWHLLAAAPDEVRRVVELGFGLSHGCPTGHIGSDECLQGTFHFGLGNDLFFGGDNDAPVHLDLVSRLGEIHSNDSDRSFGRCECGAST